ncbi:helicase protein [Dictyocaulus viviparus]|uniref:Helicase protein n=1 Tax=Dictyocaulus viviparus TaxID=29172 RepID=A0A0D8XT66_DICVI|nr:helicase protein [Dictyocaulus viviparus]
MVHPLTHTALISAQLHFPELRLIEYDCGWLSEYYICLFTSSQWIWQSISGKLQALARLLRHLYTLKHRCLIFTQMSRMLDVLQAFLSYHGYQYFRLDGTTGVEQRQAMMERFNADPKIFCFILSTRSGGVGVNLTGADTVIFYDSDWNPTMDAQAQDRCHRIGQTRNVTIFRLISEKTIEENILRKANQKRRLGEMAIDEAGFTPDFFKKVDNIRDLFDVDVEIDLNSTEGPKSQKDVEKAMALLEDEQDVTAARLVMAESSADKAEFDESKNLAVAENSAKVIQSFLDNEEPLDDKYVELISQLKPIERYAVNFLEAEYKPDFEEEVRETQAMIEQKREEWVRAHNKALCDGDSDVTADGDSFNVDDDFYGAGILLDEVRSRRKNRVSASATASEAVACRGAPHRHSVRLSLPHENVKKTISGRRNNTPNSLSTRSLSSVHDSSSSIGSLQISTTQPTLRSAVHKTVTSLPTTRISSRHSRTEKVRKRSITSQASTSNENKRRRRRKQRKVDSDCSSVVPSVESIHSNINVKSPTREQVSLEKPNAKTNSPVTPSDTAPRSDPPTCHRSPTIASSAIPSASSPSILSPSRSLPSSPFKSDCLSRTRFPVRTLPRHPQLSFSSNQYSTTPSQSSFQSSTVRLPVRVLHSSSSSSRQSTHSAVVSNPPVHSSTPLLVRRPGVSRAPIPMRVMSAERSQQRYVVLREPQNRVNVILPTTTVHHAVMPIRRVVVQPRNATGADSRVFQRPGLGEYERPRLHFRHRTIGNGSMESQQRLDDTGSVEGHD